MMLPVTVLLVWYMHYRFTAMWCSFFLFLFSSFRYGSPNFRPSVAWICEMKLAHKTYRNSKRIRNASVVYVLLWESGNADCIRVLVWIYTCWTERISIWLSFGSARFRSVSANFHCREILLSYNLVVLQYYVNMASSIFFFKKFLWFCFECGNELWFSLLVLKYFKLFRIHIR